MIAHADRPDEFNHLSDDLICFTFKDAKGPYMHVGLEIRGEYGAVHVTVKRWSHNIVKQVRVDWSTLVAFMKGRGVTKIVASHEDITDIKWPKFINLFGFPKPNPVMMSILEV